MASSRWFPVVCRAPTFREKPLRNKSILHQTPASGIHVERNLVVRNRFGAVLSYTAASRSSLHPPIRVNPICVGAVWTAMQDRIAAELGRYSVTYDRGERKKSFFACSEITRMKQPQTPQNVRRPGAFAHRLTS